MLFYIRCSTFAQYVQVELCVHFYAKIGLQTALRFAVLFRGTLVYSWNSVSS